MFVLAKPDLMFGGKGQVKQMFRASLLEIRRTLKTFIDSK